MRHNRYSKEIIKSIFNIELFKTLYKNYLRLTKEQKYYNMIP